jgi:hypothetical protein
VKPYYPELLAAGLNTTFLQEFLNPAVEEIGTQSEMADQNRKP